MIEYILTIKVKPKFEQGIDQTLSEVIGALDELEDYDINVVLAEAPLPKF